MGLIRSAYAGGAPYTIDNSLIFNDDDSAYFSRTPSASNRKTWTYSTWVKRGSLGQEVLFGAGSTGTDYEFLRFESTGELRWARVISSALDADKKSNALYRDTAAWMHIVLSVDAANTTASLYVNGIEVSYAVDDNPSNIDASVNNAIVHYVGSGHSGVYQSFYDGYMAETHFIDGQALTPDDFGKVHPVTNQWVPKAYEGTYGTNGFYLNVENNILSETNTEATITAPFGGVASNVILNDAVYLTTNTTTGSGFTAVELDYGEIRQFQSIATRGIRFNNGTTSSGVLEISDDGVDWTVLQNLSLTSSFQNFIYDAHVSARYVRVRVTAFAINGYAQIDAMLLTGSAFGLDSSGNFNNFYQTGFSTTDQTTDTPTNNYCVFNYLDSFNSPTFSEGNTKINVTNAERYGYGTVPAITGKWVWEITYNSFVTTDAATYGIVKVDGDMTSGANYLYYTSNGEYWNGSSSSAYGASFTSGDRIRVEVNYDSGQIEFFKNNASQGVKSFTVGSAAWVPMTAHLSGSGSSIHTFETGAKGFVDTPTSGFVALSTQNLPEPEIKIPGNYFKALNYVGDGAASHAITGVGFQPDLTWIKNRDNAYSHPVCDAVRGAGEVLYTNNTNAEITATTVLSSFGSDGFTVGTSAGSNENLSNHISWNWKESALAGFDIVSYVGTAANKTVNHGLGVTPEMMIIKGRDDGVQGWAVWHNDFSATQVIDLHDTGAVRTSTSVWNSVLPNSAAFYIGNNSQVNIDAQNYIAYLFASVEGFSKFDSYTGNGSTDGPFINLGFRPAYLLIKRTDVANNWEIHDTARAPYNASDTVLQANSSNAEVVADRLDFVSNGFKIRTVSSDLNASGGTYIYAAFAEYPFKYANAR